MSSDVTTYADGALKLALRGPLATLTLERPAARNALNVAMWTDLPLIVSTVAADASVRVLVVRGAGGNFASGADIAEFPTVFADREAALDYGRRIETATGALAALKKPVIALIEGYCLGAGLAVALACDLRIAAETARFGAPPAKLGLIYSLGDTRRLMTAIGASATKTMLFTGVLHSAAEALRLGLVDQMHDPGSLDGAVLTTANVLADRSSWSIRYAKEIVDQVLNGAVADTEETRGWFADAVEGPDFAEGLAAFYGKRTPVFRAPSQG